MLGEIKRKGSLRGNLSILKWIKSPLVKNSNAIASLSPYHLASYNSVKKVALQSIIIKHKGDFVSMIEEKHGNTTYVWHNFRIRQLTSGIVTTKKKKYRVRKIEQSSIKIKYLAIIRK